MIDSPNSSTASTATPKPTHTPGPWVIADRLGKGFDRKIGIRHQSNTVTGGIHAEVLTGHITPEAYDRQESNARRIVACVNACEGIPTEHLGQFSLKDLVVAATDALGDDSLDLPKWAKLRAAMTLMPETKEQQQGLSPPEVATLKTRENEVFGVLLTIRSQIKSYMNDEFVGQTGLERLHDLTQSAIDAAIEKKAGTDGSQEPTESVATLKRQRDELLGAFRFAEQFIKSRGIWDIYSVKKNVCSVIANATAKETETKGERP